MDSDSEMERILLGRGGRPPSSYGSMRSDIEDEETEHDRESPCEYGEPAVPLGLQLNRSTYPETLHTQTTEQPQYQDQACVIDTRFEEEIQYEEEEEEEEENISGLNSPVPPSPVEDEGRTEYEEEQAGQFHPEMGMPHVFKNIRNVLSGLSDDERANFKIRLCRDEKCFDLQELLPYDCLDLVDKMIVELGYECALKLSISCLESMKKVTEAQDLEEKCKRVLLRFQLRQHIQRRFKVLYEGVPRPGRQQLLDSVYVQPQITRRHAADAGHIHVNDLFRLQRAGGGPVRTLVTTGLPGIGMSVVAARFSMDWADEDDKKAANKDIQFVIPLSFEGLWSIQKFHLPPSKQMSIMDVIGHFYQGFGDVGYLNDPKCRFLILMDSFDCYFSKLDWKKTPIVTDIHAPVHLEVLIVNLIRGNLLPSACLWILGRAGAVSSIPPELVDVVTDIHGFSDEMKDEYLCRRFQDEELARNIVSHYKRSPVLAALCRQPFVCWLAATAFQRCYRYQGYGAQPPRLTPFCIHMMVIQTNRKLQRYRGQAENQLKWSQEDVNTLLNLGKLALSMVEKQVWTFSQQDLKQHGLEVTEVVVHSGLCSSEMASLDADEGFCFLHTSFQEFMAAIYLFMVFHLEGPTALKDPGRGALSLPKRKLRGAAPSRSAVDLLRPAARLAAGSPRYGMVLRFLCGMVSRGSHNDMLRGKLFAAPPARMTELDGAQKLLEREVENAPPDRRENLRECLREIVQEDE